MVQGNGGQQEGSGVEILETNEDMQDEEETEKQDQNEQEKRKPAEHKIELSRRVGELVKNHSERRLHVRTLKHELTRKKYQLARQQQEKKRTVVPEKDIEVSLAKKRKK